MTGWLTAPVAELFGEDATAEEAYELLTVDVPPSSWLAALRTARSVLGCTFFDWLSAVDEPESGFRVAAHVVALAPVRRLLLRTTVPHEAPVLPSAVEEYAGAAWHERETHEMFGIGFEGHPHLVPLLLPDGFEGHPLRKDFVLAARVVKAWPGAKEPGESGHGGPRRRQMLPPGVPDPNEWGPQKGTLPAGPARPARGAARAGDRPGRAASGATGEEAAPSPSDAPGRPARATRPRRTRSVSGGSASQRDTQDTSGPADQEDPSAARSQGDASGAGPQGGSSRQGGSTTGQNPNTSGQGSGASGQHAQAPREGAGGSREGAEGSQEGTGGSREGPEGSNPTAQNRRSGDAPWHHAPPAADTDGDEGTATSGATGTDEGAAPQDGPDRGEDPTGGSE